nr:MAK10-like protein [Tanacetum cinerariifolium]
MGDANPIHTLEDYSKPSHEGYMNTIDLPEGNNVVPLRSNIIRLVQNECSFHGLWSEDPNQHLKDFLKLVDSLDLDVANRERMRLQTTFKAQVQDYMTIHTERMERFEIAILKQWDKINTRMGEMFGLLKELTVSQTPDKVLVKEEAMQPITKYVNVISLVKIEKEKGTQANAIADNDTMRLDGSDTVVPMSEVDKKNEAGNEAEDEIVKSAEEKLNKTDEEKSGETPYSQPIGYYLKHKINKKLVEGLIKNQ